MIRLGTDVRRISGEWSSVIISVFENIVEADNKKRDG